MSYSSAKKIAILSFGSQTKKGNGPKIYKHGIYIHTQLIILVGITLYHTYFGNFMSVDWQTDALQIRMKIVSDKKAMKCALE